MPKIIIGKGEIAVSELDAAISNNGNPLLKVTTVNVLPSKEKESDPVRVPWAAVVLGLRAAYHDISTNISAQESASVRLQIDEIVARVLLAGLLEHGVLTDEDVQIAVRVASGNRVAGGKSPLDFKVITKEE